MTVHDYSRRPMRFSYLKVGFPWFIALPLLLITSKSYAKATYHADWWAVGSTVVLCMLATEIGLPFDSSLGSFGKRLKGTALAWGLPLLLCVHAAFDLPARFAKGVVTTSTVHYHAWGSRHCTVNVSYYDPIVAGSIGICVKRDQVGEVPGDAEGDVTVKATPFGIQLLKFESHDPDKRNQWGRSRTG